MASLGGPECEVCMEAFDETLCRPKLLVCGHTVCRGCVAELLSKASATGGANAFLCPKCRVETQCAAPEALTDNFYVLSLLEEPPKAKANNASGAAAARFWCVECLAVADGVCEEKHTICRLRKERGRQLKGTLDLLERAARTQRRLAERMRDAAEGVHAAMGRRIDEVVQAGDDVQRALTALYDGLELVGPDWDRVAEAAEQARRDHEERLPVDEDSLRLLEGARRCEVAVHGADGGCWAGDVGLDPQHEQGKATLALLLGLQRAGLLPRREPQAEALPQAEPLEGPVNEATKPETQQIQPAAREDKAVQTEDTPVDSGAETGHPSRPVEDPPIGAPEQAIPAELECVLGADPLQAEAAPQATLDVSELSATGCRERRDKKDDLLRGSTNVAVLLGLRCDVDRDWACALLCVLGPRLESLQLLAPLQEHLQAVTVMPRLRTLSLSGTGVAASLAGLPPFQQRLDWLELDVPLGSVAAVLRPFASVRALRLHLAAGEPQPRLEAAAAELGNLLGQRRWLGRAFGRAADTLQFVVLVREKSASRPTTGSDHDALCRRQVEAFQARLPAGVTVVCNACRRLRVVVCRESAEQQGNVVFRPVF